MARKDPSYYDYDRKASITCPGCAWRGPAEGHEEFFREVLEVKCPECRYLILVVPYPTTAEVRETVASGNQRARTDLLAAEYIENRMVRAKRLQLERPDQLPDLAGTDWIIEWDYEDVDGEHWTVIRSSGQELWREIAFFEGYRRFEEVFEILRQRYGNGLREVRPTRRSELFLYGDSLTAARIVEQLNASLRRTRASS